MGQSQGPSRSNLGVCAHVDRNKHQQCGIVALTNEICLQTFNPMEQCNILHKFYSYVFVPEHVVTCPVLERLCMQIEHISIFAEDIYKRLIAETAC